MNCLSACNLGKNLTPPQLHVLVMSAVFDFFGNKEVQATDLVIVLGSLVPRRIIVVRLGSAWDRNEASLERS